MTGKGEAEEVGALDLAPELGAPGERDVEIRHCGTRSRTDCRAEKIAAATRRGAGVLDADARRYGDVFVAHVDVAAVSQSLWPSSGAPSSARSTSSA